MTNEILSKTKTESKILILFLQNNDSKINECMITSNLFKGQCYSTKAKNIKVISRFKFIKILNAFQTIFTAFKKCMREFAV